jgi:hypothetical protein
MQKRHVTAPIIGPRTMEQLQVTYIPCKELIVTGQLGGFDL